MLLINIWNYKLLLISYRANRFETPCDVCFLKFLKGDVEILESQVLFKVGLEYF